MTLDSYEKIFLVQVGEDKKKRPLFAQFRFKPYMQMEKLLDNYNIKYQEFTERFSKVRLVTSGQQPITSYKVPVKNKEITEAKYHYIFFTSDIIEKVFDYYNIEYEKGVKYND